MSDAWDETETPEVESRLVEDLDRLTGQACGCGAVLCGHGVLCSVALGFKDAPLCLACLARGLGRDLAELREDLTGYIQRRDCYRRAWEVASDREGLARTARPPCLWPGSGNAVPKGMREGGREATTGEIVATESWDAGEMSCGDLVLALRKRLNVLAPGVVFKVTARDPAAPEDLPSWCRLTGHRLLRADHPEYLIQRKEG